VGANVKGEQAIAFVPRLEAQTRIEAEASDDQVRMVCIYRLRPDGELFGYGLTMGSVSGFACWGSGFTIGSVAGLFEVCFTV
jgi:hypothetical protein